MRWRKSVDQLNCFKDQINDQIWLDVILETLIAAIHGIGWYWPEYWVEIKVNLLMGSLPPNLQSKHQKYLLIRNLQFTWNFKVKVSDRSIDFSFSSNEHTLSLKISKALYLVNTLLSWNIMIIHLNVFDESFHVIEYHASIYMYVLIISMMVPL